nr:hypothetical protein Iba_chr09cCG13590 [Ipomoea batatas]
MLNPFTLAKSPTKSCLCGRNARRLSPSLLAQCGGVAGLSAVLEASAAAAAGFSGFGVPFLKDGVKKTKLSLPSLLLRWMRSRSFHRFDQPVELLFFGEDFSAGAAFGRHTHFLNGSRIFGGGVEDFFSASLEFAFVIVIEFEIPFSKSTSPDNKSRLKTG